MLSLNSHLTTFEMFTRFFNWAAVLWALYWNVRAAKTHVLFPTRLRVAALCLFYVVAYPILIFSEILPLEWTRFMATFSSIAFIVVWGEPARAFVKNQQKLGTDLADAVLKRMGLEEVEEDTQDS